MVDDVLRMRATIVGDQALAEIRKLERGLEAWQRRGVTNVNTINTTFVNLGKTIKTVGNEITSAIPALGGFGLGAAGVGLALGALGRTLNDTAKRIVELKYASKELGMSERELRGWSLAAEKVGVSAEALISNFGDFKRTTDEMKIGIGEARNQLYALGAGPVVARINAATNQADKLRITLQMRDTLLKEDPSGFKAKKWMEAMQLGALGLRVSLNDAVEAMNKMKPRTREQEEAAEKFRKELLLLGEQWDELKVKVGVKLFPFLTEELQNFIKDTEMILRNLGRIISFGKDVATTKGSLLPPEQQRGPRTPAESFAGGYTPMSFGGGGGSQLSEGSRMVKDGVFAALVDFMSYVQTGGTGGGGGGIMPASFGGSGGAAAGGGVGGGGWGGGGYSVVPDASQGSGRSSGVGGVPNAPSGSSVGGAPAGANTSGVGAGRGRVGKGGDPRGMEQHIRETAAKYGIDPDTAVAVAKSEGLSTFQSSVPKSGKGSHGGREDSWGAFQLYMGGGLGNAFQKQTGLDPRDPANEKAGIDFALKHASKNGWGSWYGARNTGIGNWAGIGKAKAPDGQAQGANVGDGGKATGDRVMPGRNLAGTDPRITEIMTKAAEGLPPGYKIQPTSGRRTSGQGQHTHGAAQDWQIIGPDGKAIRNRGDDTTGLYTQLARNAYGYQEKEHPDLTGKFHWGGQFGTSARNPNEPDLMHFGFGGRRGRIGKYSREAIGAVYPPTDRIDTNVAGGQNVSGNVNVRIESNGTAAKGSATTDGLWQKSTIENYKQMQPTNAPANLAEAQ